MTVRSVIPDCHTIHPLEDQRKGAKYCRGVKFCVTPALFCCHQDLGDCNTVTYESGVGMSLTHCQKEVPCGLVAQVFFLSICL